MIEQKEQDFFDRVDYSYHVAQCDMCDSHGLIELTNGDNEPYGYKKCDHVKK